ncbi:MAG: [FeFe] hydrogenase H-cluster maturation GTPase HydF [Campylobacteraceae bacterium]|jgi:[FeFe] hydrogenase H-cluster maturation GTPase HydF|nr:[FeFe] hydrogenase H-cluster maturation GTPase HydF [Campylobacteraceae bacterium]
MINTPKGLRLHIGIFGRRNVGKSSLANLITNQTISIVSNIAGTTTDPVEKAMEIYPLGAVVLIDTAGIDDEGSLGKRRVERTKKVIDKTDIAIIVTESNRWGEFEEELLKIFESKATPFMVVCNKIDIDEPSLDFVKMLRAKSPCFLAMSAKEAHHRELFFEKIQEIVPQSWIKSPTLLGDLVGSGDIVILVTPIDIQAPKGRMILPQVQALRDTLDKDAICIFVKEDELVNIFATLNKKPKLVVCDSQCVLSTVKNTPKDVMLTTFSILMAKLKGDLSALVNGAAVINTLKNGDKILIAEACTHHELKGDIGREKIPNWLTEYTKANLQISHCNGRDYPDNVGEYRLIIHCGGCVINGQEMLSRIDKAQNANVPITNYGVAISLLQGVLERAIEPHKL